MIRRLIMHMHIFDKFDDSQEIKDVVMLSSYSDLIRAIESYTFVIYYNSRNSSHYQSVSS